MPDDEIRLILTLGLSPDDPRFWGLVECLEAFILRHDIDCDIEGLGLASEEEEAPFVSELEQEILKGLFTKGPDNPQAEDWD